MILTFTHDCHNCGTKMKHRIIQLLDINESENEIIYPILFVGQMEFICPNLDCQKHHMADDINIITEDDFD